MNGKYALLAVTALVLVTGCNRGAGNNSAANASATTNTANSAATVAPVAPAAGGTPVTSASLVGTWGQDGCANAMTFAADVTDPEAVSRMVADAEARFGSAVDILVNNASGPTAQKPLLDMDWSDMAAHLDTQL